MHGTVNTKYYHHVFRSPLAFPVVYRGTWHNAFLPSLYFVRQRHDIKIRTPNLWLYCCGLVFGPHVKQQLISSHLTAYIIGKCCSIYIYIYIYIHTHTHTHTQFTEGAPGRTPPASHGLETHPYLKRAAKPTSSSHLAAALIPQHRYAYLCTLWLKCRNVCTENVGGRNRTECFVVGRRGRWQVRTAASFLNRFITRDARDSQGLGTWMGQETCPYRKGPEWPQSPLGSLFSSTGAVSPKVKWPGRGANSSPPSNTKMKND